MSHFLLNFKNPIKFKRHTIKAKVYQISVKYDKLDFNSTLITSLIDQRSILIKILRAGK